MGRRRSGGDDAAFVSVDTKTGKLGELRDEEDGDDLNSVSSEGEIVGKGVRGDTRESGERGEGRRR